MINRANFDLTDWFFWNKTKPTRERFGFLMRWCSHCRFNTNIAAYQKIYPPLAACLRSWSPASIRKLSKTPCASRHHWLSCFSYARLWLIKHKGSSNFSLREAWLRSSSVLMSSCVLCEDFCSFQNWRLFWTSEEIQRQYTQDLDSLDWVRLSSFLPGIWQHELALLGIHREELIAYDLFLGDQIKLRAKGLTERCFPRIELSLPRFSGADLLYEVTRASVGIFYDLEIASLLWAD